MSISTLWISDHMILPVPAHTHGYFQLFVCQHGHGEVGIGERVFEVAAGCALLIKPNEEHRFGRQDGVRATEVKFSVTDAGLAADLARLPTELDLSPTLLRISFREVVREGLSGAQYSHASTNAALTLFLVRLLRENGIEGAQAGLQSCLFENGYGHGGARQLKDADLLCVLDYVERRLAEEITLDDLCELVHLERSHLITRFKRLYGMSPMRYVSAMRVERAKLLLATTDRTVTDIAYETGFGSIHYFSRCFKRAEGLTPCEYRERKKG